jgi:signal transduction histidine kinase
MRFGFRQWFAERAELVVLALTLLATASLVVWWTILLRGEMHNNEVLERELLAAHTELSIQQVADKQLELDAHHGRRKVMLVGESTMLALLLSGSLVALFLLAQRRKQQREDMEKLLQLTSHEFKTPVAGVKGLLHSAPSSSSLASWNAIASSTSPRPSLPINAPWRASRARVRRASTRHVSLPICSRIARVLPVAAACSLRSSMRCRCWRIATACA